MQREGLTAAGTADRIEDADLMAALVRGDRAAMATLYDRHASLLMALAVRMLQDRAQAEELLHDVFLEAWHHARDYDASRGTVRAWLLSQGLVEGRDFVVRRYEGATHNEASWRARLEDPLTFLFGKPH